MILIKLGGSIITNKQKPLSARPAAIRRICKTLAGVDEPLVVVHGGGSFGHYWSVKYDMHTRPSEYPVHGVSVVKNSMVKLTHIVLDIMADCQMNPYCVPPVSFMDADRPVPRRVMQMRQMTESGFVPVTFGDALWYGGKSYILSGDRIMTHLARILRPRLAVFALNVDGVYSDMESGRLVGTLGKGKITTDKVSMDVTGGMRRKIDESRTISRLGTRVFLTNGNRPQRIADAILGAGFHGTVIG